MPISDEMIRNAAAEVVDQHCEDQRSQRLRNTWERAEQPKTVAVVDRSEYRTVAMEMVKMSLPDPCNTAKALNAPAPPVKKITAAPTVSCK
jgi:hypothetical protein